MSKEAKAEVHKQAAILTKQLGYFDFVSERTGERIVVSMPSAEDIGLFLARMGWRAHPELATMRKSADADGQPIWVENDAADEPQREFPIPDLTGRNLPEGTLDQLEEAIKRARAKAAEMGVDLTSTRDDAG